MFKILQKNLRVFFIFLLGLALVNHFFLEDLKASGIEDEKLHILLKWQRKLDHYSPLSKNHLQGTHNSYNSDAYHSLVRYHDRQQRLSVKQQLENGARFIELDTHWTFRVAGFKQNFLLCHGSSKFNFLPFHWGCSPFDLPLKNGLEEISEWIHLPENADEFVILYIEDHSEGHHEELYQLLDETNLLAKIYPSGGCVAIPDELTKADVLAAGKQIVFWKDELRLGRKSISCAENQQIAKLAYNDLGNLKRKAEDRTMMGSLEKRLRHGEWPRIEPHNVHEHLLAGVNILNLDNFEQDDERLYQLLWSWNLDTGMEMKEACAAMQNDGRWLLLNCSDNHHVACVDQTFTQWKVSEHAGNFEKANVLCESLSTGEETFHFSAPTNFSENKHLMQAKEDGKHQKIWLNVRHQNDDLLVGDKRAYASSIK